MSKILLLLLLLLALPLSPVMAASQFLSQGTPLELDLETRTPLQYVLLAFEGGPGLIDQEDQAVIGMLTRLIPEGPADIPLEEFRHRMFLLGSRLSANANTGSFIVSVGSRPDHLEQSLKVLIHSLQKPRLTEESWQRAFQSVENEYLNIADNMTAQLQLFATLDFFSGQPAVRNGLGSLKDLKKTTREKVQAKLPILLDPRHMQIASSGPMDMEKVKELLEKTLKSEGLLQSPYENRSLPALQMGSKKAFKVALVDKKDATDNQLFLMHKVDLAKDNVDMVSEGFAVDRLGGGAIGDLFKILREKKGLTYGAGAFIVPDFNFWGIWTFGSVKNMPALLQGSQSIVEQQLTRKPDEKLTKILKQNELSAWADSRELTLQRSMQRMYLRFNHRSEEFYDHKDEYIAKVTEDSIHKATQKLFKKRDAVIYMMGDKSKLLPILNRAGYKGKDIRVISSKDLL